MRHINLRYVEEAFDDNGVLDAFSLHYPDNFNWAYDVVDDIATHDPDRPAMVWCNPEGEEHRFSFADIKHWSDKTATFLRQQGVGKGDLVLVILRRHYQFWFVAVALQKLGAVMVPATFMLREKDMIYRLQSAGIKTVISTHLGPVSGVVDNVAAECPELKTRILVHGGAGGLDPEDGPANSAAHLSGAEHICELETQRPGWVDFNSGVRAAQPLAERVEVDIHDPMLMYFSSGTSGNPKMVLHNGTYALAHTLTAKHWHNVVSDGGLHFTIADTGWGKAVWGKFYGQWTMEACVLTYDFDRFHAGEIMNLIQRHQVSTLCCPPTMYRLLMQEGVEKYDTSSLTHCSTAGEALNPDLFDYWKRATGLVMYEGFGQTETPPTIANVVGSTPRPGSMGKPVPLFTLELKDPQGNPVATGETGEVCIAYDPANPPDGIMMGYYREPARTASVIHDGWYHTGDLAWRDEEGYLWYVGRNDDVIKASGYSIGPFEIESVMLEHPAVREVAVTGVPDKIRGMVVKATVVLFDGYEPSKTLTRELQQWVKKNTASYKYPRVIDYAAELPKTTNGKIRRVAIREADVQKAQRTQDGSTPASS